MLQFASKERRLRGRRTPLNSDERKNDTAKVRETAILKQSNQLSEIPLQGFTAHEIDLFYGICYFAQNKGEEEVVIPFNELRSLLGIERRGDKKLKEEMQETAFKFSKISVTEESENEFYTIVPFYGFRLNTKTKTFAVQVHKDFIKALNYLDGTPGNRYTLADVKAISQMKSVFSKHALQMMFYLRNAGYWYVSVENLRKYLDIPAGYKLGNITQRVIEPIRKEFKESGIFEDFEIIENKDDSQSGKGRKKVVSYTFRFRFKPDYFEAETLPKQEGVIACPKCGKPLYKIERKDGTGYFFGHYGGHKKGADCNYTASPALDIDAEDVKVSIEEKDDEVSVSKSELREYYSYIRDEEQEARRLRAEKMRIEDPELWEMYEERERCFTEFVSAMTSVRLGDRTEEDVIAREEVQKKREALSDALEKKGYDRDYFDVRYRCEDCKDSGMLPSGYFCSCRKERAKEAAEWIKGRKQQ